MNDPKPDGEQRFAPHELGPVEVLRDGKWIPLDNGPEDSTASRIINNEKERERDAARDDRQRAEYAVMDVAKRSESTADLADVNCLLRIIGRAIRALERSPRAAELRANSAEWPSMVPGGPLGAPLWNAWIKSFAALNVGKARSDLPRTGKTDYSKGKPALVCRKFFSDLEELRLEGLIEVYQALMDAGALEREPEYMTSARSLPELGPKSVTQWRDVALAALEHFDPDWRAWLKLFPGRATTAMNKAEKKASYLPGEFIGIDIETAKSTVALALLDGFQSLVKDAAKAVK